MIRDIKIKKAVYRGFGLSFLYGRPVFILHAFPGEKVRAGIRRKGRKVFRGDLLEILDVPSPHRREPECSYSGICGGCHYQELDYNYQCDLKRDILIENLQYIGKIDEIPDITINYSPHQFRYRPQCGFAVNTINEKSKLGYYRFESHQFIDITDCLLLTPELIELRHELEDFITINLSDLRNLDFIDIRESTLTHHFTLTFGFRGPLEIESDILYQKARKRFPLLTGLLVKGWNNELFLGAGETTELVHNRTFVIGPGSFFQNNLSQWEPIQNLVNRRLELHSDDHLLDLFCGIGFWSIGINDEKCPVLGFECNERSVQYAELNAKNNNISDCRYEVRDLSQGLGTLDFQPDKIIINPPRSGCSKRLLNEVATLNAEKILYMSCDPPSLARDIARLIRKGNLTIQSIDFIDMFPQTFSIETAVVLVPQ